MNKRLCMAQLIGYLLLILLFGTGTGAANAAAANGYLIVAGPPSTVNGPNYGLASVQGYPGAVPGGSSVSITNTKSGDAVTATAGSDGSFIAKIRALNGDPLSIHYTGSDSISILTFSPTIIGVMPTIGGTVNDMTIVDSHGYVADSVGLRIVDLSAPNNPQVVGTVPTTTKAAGVVVSGQYAYVATAYNNNALSIIDISDKTNPHTASSLFPSSGGSCIALSVNGSTTLAYVGGYFNGKGSGLYVVDVSNPLTPSALGFISLSASPQALLVADRYVYLAMGSAGVQIVDVVNPNAPLPVTSYTAVGNASRLAFLQTSVGGTLAVPTSTGLKLVNVSNPAAPQLAATAFPTTAVYDVVPAGNGQVVIATGYPSNGLKLLDVTLPASPQVLGSLPTDGIGSRIYLGTAGLALLTTLSSSPGLNVIDARSLTKLGNIPVVSNAMALAVSGTSVVTGTNTYSQVGGNRNTLFFTGNVDPKEPVNAGSLGQGGVFTSLAYSEYGQWVLLGGNNGTDLQVVDAASKTLIGRVALPFGSNVNATKVRGNLAYVAGGMGGLFIVDLGSDGRTPRIIGTVDTAGGASGVDVVGQYAYVADGLKGLQVVNISNPQAPALVGGSISTPGAALSLRVQGQYLYLATATTGTGNGLMVFDLANPAAPVSVAMLATTGYARNLDAMGNLVYIASDNAGLIIIDVSNPLQPVAVKTVKTFSYCRDVKVSGNLVYLADDAAVQVVVAVSPVLDVTPVPPPPPPPAVCTYAISPASQQFNAPGGTGNTNMTTLSTCAWSASSNVPWISVVSGSSGTGNGTITYSVTANTDTQSRTGTLTIGGQTFTVTQQGQACTYAISPTSYSFTSGASSASVTVTCGSSCAWSASTTYSWINITSGAMGSGNGTVNYSVSANTTTTARTGTLTVGGQTFSVNQDGVTCSYSISPVSQSFTSAAAPGSVSVTATTGCSWTASSNASWISITAGTSGSGNGSAGYSVAANTTISSRTGTLTIAGQTHTVTQAGQACAYTISPTSSNIAASATTGSVSVTCGSGCAWTASSNASWITLTSGTSGSGNGTVSYSVTANTTTAPRSGTLTVAGQTFNITQQGQACTYTISPASNSFTSAAGTGSVSVTCGSGCAWTASSNASWITLTSGTSGSGNGTVSYTVSANGGAARNGTLTIAGQTFSVNQEAAPSAPPKIGVNPATVDFGYVGLYATATQQVIVANPGSGNLTITGTGISGTDASMFTRSTDCGTVLPGASCTVSVTFRRTTSSTSVRTATLTISSNDADMPQARVALYAMRAPACTYNISPLTQSFSAQAGTASVSVGTASGCAWTGSTNASWITITSGSSGTGNGTVNYLVAANTTTTSRTGTMTVAGQTFSVTQQGQACTYTISPANNSFTSAAGTGSVSVACGSSCTWTASSNASWVTLTSGTSSSGNGSVGYSVAANVTTASRSGTLTIAGQTFTVSQAAGTQVCTYSISPAGQSFGSSAGTGSVSVTAPSGCAWTAATNTSWIGITAGNGGTGNGTVSYSVSANTDTSSRTGTLTIAGQTFSVTQQGQACTYSITPANASYNSAAQAGTVAVTTAPGCAWTAASNASWMALAPNSGGTGNGTVPYSVGPNTTTQSRTGTITIANQTFTVTQDAASSGSPKISVSPTSLNFGTIPNRSSSSKMVTVSNTGAANLVVSSISLWGASSSHFRQSNTCGTVAPGSSCTITMTFAPFSTGSKMAYANVYSNDPVSPTMTIYLSGTAK